MRSQTGIVSKTGHRITMFGRYAPVHFALRSKREVVYCMGAGQGRLGHHAHRV